MEIANILYPHSHARDDEVVRLDGVLLSPGVAIINRVPYYLQSKGPPEYTLSHQTCTAVTYRWWMRLVKEY